LKHIPTKEQNINYIIMRFPITGGANSLATIAVLTVLAAIPGVLISAENSTFTPFTEVELMLMRAFDWCHGKDVYLIHWINKSNDTWQATIKDGARFAPERNEEGKIADLDGFVKDRLEALPAVVVDEALPSLIIEDFCVGVENSTTEECIFDFGELQQRWKIFIRLPKRVFNLFVSLLFVILLLAGTPGPLQWALQDGIAGISPSITDSVPPEISSWEREDQMTVVFVPASNSYENAKEITSNDPKAEEPELASLKVRGNTSRKSPKKQFQLKLPEATEMIPGGSVAKKWVISAYPSDYTYIENPIVFETYRKMGELQKEHGNWPEEGSIEDLATQAWAPRSMPVNFIFQGRYIGLYYIMDKVDLDDRIWIPPEPQDDEDNNNGNETTALSLRQMPMAIDGMTLPMGSYLLEYDWSERNKKFANPDRVISDEENEFYLPNRPEGASELYVDGVVSFYSVLEPLLCTFAHSRISKFHSLSVCPFLFLRKRGFDNIHAWVIGGPDDKTFAANEEDEDIALLQRSEEPVVMGLIPCPADFGSILLLTSLPIVLLGIPYIQTKTASYYNWTSG
jgi:hypothetical protein